MTTAPLVDYWFGWSVAFYQHETGTPYRRIFEAVPYDEFADSYHPLHEAPESKFVEAFERASAENVLRLARALHCQKEDLMEL